ncbi:helix-turn-helix domain-containing protein [Streptomyces sp. NPDC002514]|uniref:helix-turn-helix domain-containing protein n=1 Tax=unclassified Streptomyces TaxID=2593676 RepID=UPI003696231A
MLDPPPGLTAFRRLLADHVREARTRRSLSQEQLAHAAGLAPRTIGAIEAGRTGTSTDSLYAIACALQVPVAQLVQGKIEPRP